MRLIILLTSFYFLLGCSATPEVETKYYLLHSPSAHNSTVVAQSVLISAQKKEALLTINISDYLKQPFLVMQTDTHTLHYTQSHLWAEPLQKELSIALRHELNSIDKLNDFELIYNNKAHPSKDKLMINIEHFHATSTGNVILSGSFKWLNNKKDSTLEKNNSEHNFYLEQVLTKDGYTHAVAQMRVLLHNLATEITQR